MDSSSSSLVTIVLDSEAFARQIEAIAHFIPVHIDSLFNLADRRLHHYRVADPAFSADDAVQDAHLKLFVDLEAIESHIRPPDEQVIADDGVERRLTLLALDDPSLRVVAHKKAEGFTHQEIADQLGQSLSTVEHRVRLIRAILEPLEEKYR